MNGAPSSPYARVRKRLFRNKLAVAGMAFLAFLFFVALLAYLIMPDATPYANEGSPEISRKPPGYQTTILKVRKQSEVEERSFLSRMVYGQESRYEIIPVEHYEVRGEQVVAVTKEAKDTLSLKLAEIVLTNAAPTEKQKNNDELRRLFLRNNIEQRTYLLGTDRAGRDMLSRLIYGARISLGIGFVAVLIALTIGINLGALAGFFGGKVDAFISWLMTVVWSVPSIILVIAISLALQNKGVWTAFVAVGLTSWVDTARLVRGQVLSLKEKNFTEAAYALGFSRRRVIFKHILPNTAGPVIVSATAGFASAILIEAGLSFLGLGVQPPVPSWGMMVNEGFRAVGSRETVYLLLLPSICISGTVFAFNLLGNGLRDAFDPKNDSI